MKVTRIQSGDGEFSPRARHTIALKMREHFFRVVDTGIPESMMQGDPEVLRCARTVVGFTLILITLGFESVLYFHMALPPEASIWVDGTFIAGLVLCALVPWSLRRTGSTALGANFVIAGSYGVIFAAFVVYGGIQSPLLHWCALLPMLAILMNTRPSAWAWAGISALTIVLFAAIEATGHRFTTYLDINEMSGPTLWVQRSVDVGSWLAILLSVVFLYERHRGEQATQLAEKNDELVHEIEQRHRAEERTRYLAYYDELTTLPNRQLFKEQLARSMELANRNQQAMGLLFLDLDGFKVVNDTHGHELGDQLLQQVAERLAHCVRAADSVGRASAEEMVSRLGGDEFTVLLNGLSDFSEAAIVARRVLRSLARAFAIADSEIFITASIGIAIHNGPEHGMEELLRNADLAMYHAKESGKNNFKFYEAEMNASVIERATLAKDLRGALQRGEFKLNYQPILDTTTGEVGGVEALMRWQHPERGLVPPDKFIPVAEESGLIVRMGEWVLNEACRQFSTWQRAGIAPRRFAVNVSGNQFRGQRFENTVIRVLQKTNVDPGCLEIEITENAIMVDEEEAARCLRELKEFGVRIAFDDFGTGYSSLSYIKRFPVDVLKIDRSFVGVIETDPEAQAIATAIIAMAHQLGLRVVAEGVETEEQARFLSEHECDELQGYRFSRPLDPEAMTQFLAERGTPSTISEAEAPRSHSAARLPIPALDIESGD